MHVLPRVRELHERHPEHLSVIGIHAGKYPTERRTDRIRTACDRLGVTHPVANDRHFRAWRAFSVQAWPTVAVIDPEGYLLGTRSGEFEVDEMDAVLTRLIAEYRGRGTLSDRPKVFGPDPAAPPSPAGALRYPGRALLHDGRLVVADTGNARVLEVGLDGAPGHRRGRVVRSFGVRGRPGLADGTGEDAAFAEPWGVAPVGDTLYAADRGNHAIRAVDMGTGEVVTVAGTGRLGSAELSEGDASQVDLRSPWGLAAAPDGLIVTMAGSHQLWSLRPVPGGHRLEHLAGSRVEDIIDGPGRRAALAQPTGVAAQDGVAWFADSEASAVRSVALSGRHEVLSAVGTGLFDHGDRDGPRGETLLQHDEDVAPYRGSVLVADTYNDKIKLVDPASGTCRALPGDAGSGEALREPAGIWAGDGVVLIADTGNHRIVELDPTDGTLAEIPIEDR